MVWTMLWSFYQKKPLFFTVKKKGYSYILVNCGNYPIIYHSSSVGNTRGALISCGEAGGGGAGRRFGTEKQLKLNNWWSCNKWGSGSNILGGRNIFWPSITPIHVSISVWFELILPQHLRSETGTPSGL